MGCLPILAWDVLCSGRPSYRRLNSSNEEYYIILLYAVDNYINDIFTTLMDTMISFFEDLSKQMKTIHPAQQQKLENDHNLMTSLVLQWLVQNCETPGSITVALQAIAGAGPRIPRGPLESCHATMHILQRLASSSYGTESDTKLYTRGLEVLGLHVKSNQEPQENSGTSNTEMIIWDLQSEHECLITNLINSLEFIPTKDSMMALTLGNSATSLTLRQLKEDGRSVLATQTFNLVFSLLSGQIISNSCQLSPAALQSLANTAILLTSSSADNLLSPSIAQQCMENCIRSLRSPPFAPQPD
ncbi:hypothetical protein FRC11_007861, partial [Ceratobasidium sp. 423]